MSYKISVANAVHPRKVLHEVHDVGRTGTDGRYCSTSSTQVELTQLLSAIVRWTVGKGGPTAAANKSPDF